MSLLAICIFLFSAIIANGLRYLCLQRQSLLDKPLPAMPWMVCGILTHLNAFFTAHTYLGLLKASVIYLLVSGLCLILSFVLTWLCKKQLYSSP